MNNNSIVNARKFISELRGSNQKIDDAAQGKFEHIAHPIEYAVGLTIGAGLKRCACGIWDNQEKLEKDGKPLPCPHKNN